MTSRATAAALAAAALLLAAPASPAAASAPETPSPWSPYSASDFRLPAGVACPFEVAGDVVADKERVRTLSTWPDGSPRKQEFAGLLKVRVTNADTGESVLRNYTGTAIAEYGADGSYTLTLKGGHFLVGLHPGDPGGPALLGFTGHGHSVRIAPDGTRTITYGPGNVENLCETLAG